MPGEKKKKLSRKKVKNLSKWPYFTVLVVFCGKFISSSTFVLDKSFNYSNSLSYGMTYLLIPVNKLCNNKASQIDIFTNKLDNSDNTSMSFFTHFDFESVLSSNTYSS